MVKVPYFKAPMSAPLSVHITKFVATARLWAFYGTYWLPHSWSVVRWQPRYWHILGIQWMLLSQNGLNLIGRLLCFRYRTELWMYRNKIMSFYFINKKFMTIYIHSVFHSLIKHFWTALNVALCQVLEHSITQHRAAALTASGTTVGTEQYMMILAQYTVWAQNRGSYISTEKGHNWGEGRFFGGSKLSGSEEWMPGWMGVQLHQVLGHWIAKTWVGEVGNQGSRRNQQWK